MNRYVSFEMFQTKPWIITIKLSCYYVHSVGAIHLQRANFWSQERDHLMIDNRKSERKNACDPHQYPFQYLDGHECFLWPSKPIGQWQIGLSWSSISESGWLLKVFCHHPTIYCQYLHHVWMVTKGLLQPLYVLVNAETASVSGFIRKSIVCKE